MELKETEIKKIPRSQEIALELLLQVKYICDKHHIKYTLLLDISSLRMFSTYALLKQGGNDCKIL